LVRADQQREVLGHETRFHSIHHGFLERLCKACQLGVAIQLAAVLQPAGPCVDRRDGVGRGFLALLVLTIVAGDRAVGGFSLDRLAIGGHQHGCHQPERAEPLRNGV